MEKTVKSDLAADLQFGLELLDRVDRFTLAHFYTQDFQVDTKPDLTPVSEIDREAERMIRAELASRCPGDRIYGEEYGDQGEGQGTSATSELSHRRWVIDPIDGTKNFVRALPVWATLLALEIDGEAQLGIVSAPGLGRRWYAYRGGGAYLRLASGVSGKPENETRHRLSVSRVDRLTDASFSYSSLTGWEQLQRRDRFQELALKVWRTRAYGDFWSYMMVAEGTVDAAAEPELEAYDMAALVPIVEEAGGRFTGLDAKSGHHSGNALATNGLLHRQFLEYLGD